MASHIDDVGEPSADKRRSDDPVGDHLDSALETTDDDTARYHLREALQLQIAQIERR